MAVVQQELGLPSVCLGHSGLGNREGAVRVHRTNDLPGANQHLVTVFPVGGLYGASDDDAGLYEGRAECLEGVVTDRFALDYALHDTSRISNY